MEFISAALSSLVQQACRRFGWSVLFVWIFRFKRLVGLYGL